MSVRGNKKAQNMVKEIMENFDFHKCHIVMKHLNWCWHFNKTPPTIQELKKSAERNIWDCIERMLNEEKMSYHAPYILSTGGFKVTTGKNRYGQLDFVNLEFVLTDWDSN